MLTSVQNLRRTLVRQIGWAVLAIAKPFGTINNALHKLSKRILDMND